MSDTKTETGRCTHSWGDIDAEGTAFYLCNYPTITNDQGELIHWGRECLHPDCKIKHRFHRQEFGHPAEASGCFVDDTEEEG